jgi:hypothetical protein
MECEHLIIIALILAALYMMNKDTKDTVKSISPRGRIRYDDAPDVLPFGHIRTRREGFDQDSSGLDQSSVGPQGRIRLGDRDWGHSQHIKNHVRHDNRNNMFSGMMGTGCGGSMPMMPIQEKFRMDTDNSSPDNMGEQQHIRFV